MKNRKIKIYLSALVLVFLTSCSAPVSSSHSGSAVSFTSGSDIPVLFKKIAETEITHNDLTFTFEEEERSAVLTFDRENTEKLLNPYLLFQNCEKLTATFSAETSRRGVLNIEILKDEKEYASWHTFCQLGKPTENIAGDPPKNEETEEFQNQAKQITDQIGDILKDTLKHI